jgi:hypothetical protein
VGGNCDASAYIVADAIAEQAPAFHRSNEGINEAQGSEKKKMVQTQYNSKCDQKEFGDILMCFTSPNNHETH